MRKNVWSFLVCAAMAAGMLSGCSGSSKPETEGAKAEGTSAGAAGEAETKKEEAGEASQAEGGEAVELTFWSLANRKEFEDKIIAAFAEKNPNVTITPTYYSTDDIKANLKVAASSGTMPDMWYNWGGSLASYYPANGLT